MNKTQRLQAAFDLKMPDRPPIMGGWLASPEHVQKLAGCSEDEYWADQAGWGIKAEKALGSDGIIGVHTARGRGDFRIVDHEVLESRDAFTIDKVLAEIESAPEPEQVKAEFTREVEDKAYLAYVAEFKRNQTACGDMAWCRSDWEGIPRVMWVTRYGYETAMMTMALHSDAWRKLMRVGSERSRQRNILAARAIRDGLRTNCILMGEDICSQQGPMVSPEYLREEYFPVCEYAIEPLVSIGAKVIYHCDGNCRPIMNDLLAIGIGGFQGFQRECGMDIEWIVDLHTKKKEPVIIMGPMQVTTTLPFGTPADIRKEVAKTMDICRDKASLVFFTSNTINPDCPLDNIKAYWDAVQRSRW